MPKKQYTIKLAMAIAKQHGHKLINNREWEEFIVVGPYFPTGYHTNDLEDAINTLMFEVGRHSKENVKQDPIIRKPYNIHRDNVTKRWMLLKHNEVLMTARTKPELLRKIELKASYGKTYKQNPGRFTVYSGDIKYRVEGDALDRAFNAAKVFSVHHGESYLYDASIDKMIAHFINGTRVQEGKQTDASRKTVYKRKGPQIGIKNPKRGVLIYAQVNRIIATKKQKHICDAECKRHGHRYFHDFTSSPKMYGLPNGDLLITTR